VPPSLPTLWTLPLFILLAILTALQRPLAVSHQRPCNVNHAAVLDAIWFFLTPVAYSATVSPQWRLAYSLNQMAGVVNGFR
jgi:ABC-type polysaccharide/polyol phosphate export permease